MSGIYEKASDVQIVLSCVEMMLKKMESELLTRRVVIMNGTVMNVTVLEEYFVLIDRLKDIRLRGVVVE